MRITTHTYPNGPDDSNRDYLVAHHIITYHEYPLTGPHEAVFKSRNSPTYYYFLAFFAQIKDDPVFLRVINSALQVITIFIIFHLAKRLYDSKTAVLASMLISFNSFSLIQSAYIWQPFIMQPFINISYLLLLISYKNKNYVYLLSSILLYFFAGSLHTSVFAIFPIFVIAILVVLKKLRAHKKHYIGASTMLLLSFLAFFFPLLIAHTKNNNILPTFSSSNILGLNGPFEILGNFIKNIPYFVGGSLFYVSSINTLTTASALIVCILLVYYFTYLKHKQEKMYSVFLIAPAVVILLCLSIVKLRLFNPTYGIHYFIPAYGLFIILFSRLLIFTFTKNKVTKILGFLLTSVYMGFFLTSVYENFYKDNSSFFPQYLNDPAINAIKRDILSVKKSNNYSDFNFFKIESHSTSAASWKYYAGVWTALERELETRLVKLDDYNHDGFIPLAGNNPKYVFLICPVSSTNTRRENDCMENFLRSNKKYEHNKSTHVSQSYQIDLMMKIE